MGQTALLFVEAGVIFKVKLFSMFLRCLWLLYTHTKRRATFHYIREKIRLDIYITLYITCGREEIQRIKAAKPDIPHREAFSMAAKNVRLLVNH